MSSFNSIINSRPGVHLTSQLIDTTPEPLPNHAIAYMFVVVPGENGELSRENYISLAPLTPTIVTSLNDYLVKIGGSIPNPATQKEAYISYKSVEAFFQNNFGNGVFYAIRVAPSGYATLEFDTATANNNYFVVVIDGVYYGDYDLGVEDEAGVRKYAIQTTGLSLEDNVYDVIQFLKNNDLFTTGYEIISNEQDISQGYLKFKSKTFGLSIDVNYFQTTATASGLLSNLVDAGYIWQAEQKTHLVFRIPYVEPVVVVDTLEFNNNFYNHQTSGVYTYFSGIANLTTPNFSDLINQYLVNKGELVLIDPDSPGYDYTTDSLEKFDGQNGYVVIPQNDSASIISTPESGVGGVTRTPLVNRLSFYNPTVSGSSISWTPIATPTLTPRSLVFYALNIGSPSDRFVFSSNGADVNQHRNSLTPSLSSAINDSYYDLVPVEFVSRGFQTPFGIASGATSIAPEILSNGLYSWDYVTQYSLVSKIGVPKYIFGGTTSNGNVETNFFRTNVNLGEALESVIFDYRAYVNAISNSLEDDNLLPGYLLFPSAYATLFDQDLLKVSSALTSVAKKKNWFALIDDSSGNISPTEAFNEYRTLVSTVGASGGFGGFYYPWLKISSNDYIPASPFVVGMAMYRIGQEGFKQPPGGTEYPLSGVLEAKYVVSSSHQEIYTPRGLNPIIRIPNKGFCVFGARTFDAGSPVQFVNSRIVANLLIYTLQRSFDQFVFDALETNNRALFARIRTVAIAILQQLYDVGGLIGDTPLDAYRVVCDRSNNSDSSLAQGIVYLYVEARLVSTLERLAIKLDLTNGTIAIG